MVRRRGIIVLATALLGVALLPSLAAAAPPQVVVSIKPIHSLVAGVMAGIGEPQLIVAGGSSPHVYSLRPSDARKLEAAQLVFWVGPILEGFLGKPLAALAGKADIVELDHAAGVALLPARQGGDWEEDEDEHHHHAASAAEPDGHLWLDPGNAKAIVHLVAAKLAALDPANAPRYASNAAALAQRLDILDAGLRQRLQPVRGRPFVVFHDAYQYLERRYGLEAIGSITVSPEHLPGARRVQAIHAKVAGLGAACVFSEPQFESRLVQTVIDGTAARTAVLDPEGASLSAGPELYFTLMTGLADGLSTCLAR
ncbi:MAG TPA: zinc ABC transporter substrate-binding protein [Stellaceae bacterium]|nr:zinc ABC transporter substrate-binding protein [Stellaceae bacterium]